MNDPIPNGGSRHVQAQSIAILGTATMVLVFAVFAYPAKTNLELSSSILLKSMAAVMAVGYYAALTKSVCDILVEERSSRLNGKILVRGPVHWMMQMMGCITLMFLLDVMQLFVR